MKVNSIIPALLSILLAGGSLLAQTTSTDGNYVVGGNWTGGSIGGTYNGSNLLTLNNEDIFIENYMILGSFGNDVDVTALNSNDNGALTINDTLIIYGDVSFANKSMELVVGAGGVLIILGSLTMNNKIDVSSDGLIVVRDDFNMSGNAGNNEYSGAGQVFAGSYSGNAQSEIDAASDPDASYSTT